MVERMQLSDLLDTKELDRLIAEHYVTARTHPSLPLEILNYTAKTQFQRYWSHETELCRGLIVNCETGEIVARPFRKFFNLGEREVAIPDETFTAYQKMDGCLAIAYIDADGLPSVATRGSFTSEQARHATRILRTKYADALPWLLQHPHLTLCFEAILPEYRIVVDYAGREDLVFLAAFDARDGAEVDPLPTAIPDLFPMAKTWTFGSLDEAVESVNGPDFDNEEGVVIRYASGLRLKVKREEYMRLHRIVTGVTPRRIWQMLKDGTPPVGRLFAGTPEGFQQWAREVVNDIEGEYRAIELGALSDYQQVTLIAPSDRKAFAVAAAESPYAPILFKLYDQKPYAEIIWKRIKPDAADPFRVEV